MQRRFPEGLDGLLDALVWIQRQAATGALGSGGGRPGVLVFRDGILSRVADAGGSPEPATGDPRGQAGALMKDWSHGDSPFLFTQGTDPAQAPGAPDALTAGDLILDLVRRNADRRWVARRLAGATGRIGSPASLPGVLPRISMTPIEAFVLSRSDGTLTIEEILQVSPLDPTEVQLALYALISAGLLTAPGVKPPGDDSQPEGSEARDPAPAPARTARSTSAPRAVPPPAPPPPPPPPARAASAQATPAARAHAASPERPHASGPVPVPAASGAGPADASSRSVLDLDAFLARTNAAAKPPERNVAPASGSPQPAAPPQGQAGPPAPGASSAPPVSDADRERAEVLGWISTRTGADYYGILGVERSADEGAIRRAYYRVAKKFHPDRFRRPGFEGLLQDVERMFAATTEAYNTLSDDRARAEYERELNARAKGGKGTEGDAASQARESYLRAKKHADAAEYFDAASLLEVACGLDPGRPEYWLLLGTVQAKNPRWRRKAEESFQKVLAINPTTMEAFLELARLYRAGGLTRKAQEMYRKVVQWDPQNEEALAVLSGKAGAQEAGVGGKLRSLFKGSRS